MLSDLLNKLLSFRQQIQLYHWSTRSYSRHIASGTLYTNLSTLIDKFIEILQGRVDRISYKKIVLRLKSVNDKKINDVLVDFRDYLQVKLEEELSALTSVSELLNLRDEMLGEVNQTLYLFSLQ